jgi:hypothetical protein
VVLAKDGIKGGDPLFLFLLLSTSFKLILMWILEYIVNGSEVRESYTFPTRDLAYWKRYTLQNQGTHVYGKFKIRKG